MKPWYKYLFFLITMLSVITLVDVAKADDKYTGPTTVCEYELYFPEFLYFRDSWAGGRTPEEACEDAYTAQTEIDQCIETFTNKDFYNPLTTIYIAAPQEGYELNTPVGRKTCEDNGDCAFYYYKTKVDPKNLVKWTMFGGSKSEINDYVEASTFKEPLTIDLAGWYNSYWVDKESSGCPDIYLKSNANFMEFRNVAIGLGIIIDSVEQDIWCEVNENLKECKKGKKLTELYLYKTVEKKRRYVFNTSKQKWQLEEEISDFENLLLCDNYEIKGVGALANVNIGLKVKAQKERSKSTGTYRHSIYLQDKKYEDISNDRLEYLHYSGEVSGLGKDFYIKLNEELLKGRDPFAQFFNGSKCLTKSQTLYVIKLEDYNGRPAYELTITEHYAEEKEEEYQPAPGPDYNEGDPVTGCEVIPKEIRKWINNILNFVRYMALALVIALGALDFMKAAGSGEPDAMKKSGQTFMKRMIAVVVLFLLPVIVDFILNMVDIYGVDKNNINCL